MPWVSLHKAAEEPWGLQSICRVQSRKVLGKKTKTKTGDSHEKIQDTETLALRQQAGRDGMGHAQI